MFFSFFLFFVTSFDLHNAVFTVWSSDTFALDRLIPMAKAWYRFVPEVHIFMLSLKNETKEKLEKEIKTANIRFHVYPCVQHCLIGSRSDTEWNSVQALHIASMKVVYEQRPNRDLYIFCDDDSYVFPDNIYESLRAWNESKPHVYGCAYGAYQHINKFYKKGRTSTFGFIQGGGGLYITKALMELIYKNNELCAYGMTSFEFPSDMKLATCIDNAMGGIEGIIIGLTGQTSGESPYGLFYQSPYDIRYPIGKPLISYHHIRSALLTERIFNSSASMFKDKVIKWDNYSMQRLVFPEDDEGRLIDYAFGFTFYRDTLSPDACHASTMFIPNNFENPTKYTQPYDCGYSVTLECDDSVNDVEYRGRRNGFEFVLGVKCPKPQIYKPEVSFTYDYISFDPY